MAYYSALSSEGNPVICNNIDKSVRHYSKKNIPDSERHILHGTTHMWNIKKDKSITNNEPNKNTSGWQGLDGGGSGVRMGENWWGEKVPRKKEYSWEMPTVRTLRTH